ncbi:MAG: hypothetical protein HUJ76_05925 [Parasporobacterium sp.]|nr:hypothetical protein [Parasporobacterium sp.]
MYRHLLKKAAEAAGGITVMCLLAGGCTFAAPEGAAAVTGSNIRISPANAAYIDDVHLMTDEYGKLKLDLFIRNPDSGISRAEYHITADGVEYFSSSPVYVNDAESGGVLMAEGWDITGTAEGIVTDMSAVVDIPAYSYADVELSYYDIDGNIYSDGKSYYVLQEVMPDLPEECETESSTIRDTEGAEYQQNPGEEPDEGYADAEEPRNEQPSESEGEGPQEPEDAQLSKSEDEGTQEPEEPQLPETVEEQPEKPEELQQPETGEERLQEPEEPRQPETGEEQPEKSEEDGQPESATEQLAEAAAENVQEQPQEPGPIQPVDSENEQPLEPELQQPLEPETEPITEPGTEPAQETDRAADSTAPSGAVENRDTYPQYNYYYYYNQGTSATPVYSGYNQGVRTETSVQKQTVNTSDGAADNPESKKESESPDESETSGEAEAEEEESESGKHNTDGSEYDLTEVEEINGRYISECADLVVFEKNADHLDDDSIIVTVSRNGETFELDKGRDYSVMLVGDSEGRKIYKYIINSSIFEDDGDYSVYFSSVDESGNKNNSAVKDSELNFCVDRTEPLILSCGVSEENGDARMNLIVRDNSEISEVGIFIGDEQIVYENDGENYSFIIPDNKKDCSITVSAKDKAGNEYARVITDHFDSAMVSAKTGSSGSPVFIIGIIGVLIITAVLIIRRRTAAKKRKTV